MKPLKLIALYDNGGKTADRYTAVTDEQHDDFRNILAELTNPNLIKEITND
jgi:hypothetical protein